MVAFAGLGPQTVRPVGDHDLRDPQPLDRAVYQKPEPLVSDAFSSSVSSVSRCSMSSVTGYLTFLRNPEGSTVMPLFNGLGSAA